MGRTLDDAVLCLVGGLGVDDINREFHLEELHSLLPFNLALQLDVRWLIGNRCGEADCGFDPALVADLCQGLNTGAVRIVFNNRRLAAVKFLS